MCLPVSCPASVLIPSRVFFGRFLMLGRSAFGVAVAAGKSPRLRSEKPKCKEPKGFIRRMIQASNRCHKAMKQWWTTKCLRALYLSLQSEVSQVRASYTNPFNPPLPSFLVLNKTHHGSYSTSSLKQLDLDRHSNINLWTTLLTWCSTCVKANAMNLALES